ncbi:MAG: M20/M25/M40 family metallo-hydrolase [Anaerolineaceae bacterium]|nr:M20/M25/M40 family metallo-hydrolase [Anaerolineaceae bacterium]
MNKDLMRQLADARGVSGQEEAPREVILAAIDGHVEDLRVDALGNVLARVPGVEGADLPRVLVSAHMDEIGFVLRSIDGDGLLRVYPVGGVDARILPGLRVSVGPTGVPGVFMWKPIHLGREQKTVPLDNLRVDIGACDRAGAAAHVKPGDMITFPSEFRAIGEGAVRGKALDNRAGCALLVELLQGEPLPCDVLVAFTTQEEIGLRGAQVVVESLQPDMAIVLESTPAHDLPDLTADPDDGIAFNPATRQGAGPVLTVMDSRTIVDPRLLNWLRATAEAQGIPFQLKSSRGGGNDAGAIHVAGSGVPTAAISMPARYVHGPAALLRVSDFDQSLALLRAALNAVSPTLLAHD